MLPFRVTTPSTLGTFLRSFTFGHVRQLDAVIAETLGRVWTLGAGPGNGRLVIDVDSTVCEVFGYQKQGVANGYTNQKGYHPFVASRADIGEILAVVGSCIDRANSNQTPPKVTAVIGSAPTIK